MSSSKVLFERRKRRNRSALRKRMGNRLRLSVFRSSKHIYAQVINDATGVTVASASTKDKEIRDAVKNGATKQAAGIVGKALAERAVKAGVKEVAFDRGGYKYHGRVQALAEAAREGGLSF